MSKSGRKTARVPHEASRRAEAAKAALPVNTDKEMVRWSFRWTDVDYQGAWDWDLQSSETKAILRFLGDMQGKTWSECLAGRSGEHKSHHGQPVTSLCREAQRRLAEWLGWQDLPDELFRFRLGGKPRLWGFRSGAVFEIIWFDRDHAVYPTGKRNT
jgi:hypothetical protein